jgi:hypothetical protein
MTKFIWVRDVDKVDHFVSVNHIVHVTKIPATGVHPEYAYMVLSSAKEIHLSNDKFDTYEEVVAKIGHAT